MEELERTPPPASITSIASLTRKSSKTPAHDIVDILSVKGKLEASEGTIENLAELVDSLVNEINLMKQNAPAISNIPDIEKNVEQLNSTLEELQHSVNNQLKSQSTDNKGERNLHCRGKYQL